MEVDYGSFELIHKKLSAYKHERDLASLARGVQLMMEFADFVEVLMADTGAPREVKTEDDLLDRAQRFLYWLLIQRRYEEAAVLLWGKDVFDPRPRYVQLIWKAIRTSSMINVIGGGSTSKSYSAIAYLILDFILDPEWTKILCVGPDSDHLSRNLWGDLARLHDAAVLRLPGLIDSESLSVDKIKGMGFRTVALDRGEKESAKLKGEKIKARDGPEHPIFGRNTRLRVIVDEAQQVPPNIFKMIVNLQTNIGGMEELKILMCANPSDEFSLFGKNCVPFGGYSTVKMETEGWLSTSGWTVVRLNGMRCENVTEGRIVFPRLIDKQKIDTIIRNCGGDDQHPDVWTFVYGMFPPQGALIALIRADWIRDAGGEWIFDRVMGEFSALDPALAEDGDLPAMAMGRVGRAVGWVDYDGKQHDLAEPMMAVQVDVVGILPKGDTQDLSNEFVDRNIQLGIKPENSGMDTTGNGIGVYDVARRQWAIRAGIKPEPGEDHGIAPINAVQYSKSPTRSKICEEDTEVPEDRFDRLATELWYAAAKFFEMGVIKLGRGVDSRTKEELAARRGGRPGQKGRKQTLESKRIYKSRTNGNSPDRADAVTILIHVARLRVDGLRPKAPLTPIDLPTLGRIDEWTKEPKEHFTRIKGLEQETGTPDFISDRPNNQGREDSWNSLDAYQDRGY